VNKKYLYKKRRSTKRFFSFSKIFFFIKIRSTKRKHIKKLITLTYENGLGTYIDP